MLLCLRQVDPPPLCDTTMAPQAARHLCDSQRRVPPHNPHRQLTWHPTARHRPSPVPMGLDSWASERQIARHHSAAASLDVNLNETRARREVRETAALRRLPEKPNQGGTVHGEISPPHENHGLGALLLQLSEAE